MSMPRETAPDSTLEFLRDPYRFISKRCAAHGTDCFRARLMLRPWVCMTGAEAAALFYDQERFTRRDASPKRIRKTLFGEGGVQGLDGRAHAARKTLLVSLLTGEGVDRMESLMSQRWEAAIRQWSDGRTVRLYDEVVRMLAGAACDWMGLSIDAREFERRAEQLRSLYDHAGNVGLKHYAARRDRRELERWIGGVIEGVRADGGPGTRTPLDEIAMHRDVEGQWLPPRVAAVEVLNILRPTVAIAVYIAMLARRLVIQPEHVDRLRDDDGRLAHSFVQEVRRHAPFFPVVAAVTTRAFEWKTHRFAEGERVLLDLYGTNHDERLWPRPDRFDAERFLRREPGAFELIPQGGGEHLKNHRCPGEWITLRLMRQALRVLVRGVSFVAPSQDLSIDFRRLPALPRSRVAIADVRLREPIVSKSGACPFAGRTTGHP